MYVLKRTLGQIHLSSYPHNVYLLLIQSTIYNQRPSLWGTTYEAMKRGPLWLATSDVPVPEAVGQRLSGLEVVEPRTE